MQWLAERPSPAEQLEGAMSAIARRLKRVEDVLALACTCSLLEYALQHSTDVLIQSAVRIAHIAPRNATLRAVALAAERLLDLNGLCTVCNAITGCAPTSGNDIFIVACSSCIKRISIPFPELTLTRLFGNEDLQFCRYYTDAHNVCTRVLRRDVYFHIARRWNVGTEHAKSFLQTCHRRSLAVGWVAKALAGDGELPVPIEVLRSIASENRTISKFIAHHVQSHSMDLATKHAAICVGTIVRVFVEIGVKEMQELENLSCATMHMTRYFARETPLEFALAAYFRHFVKDKLGSSSLSKANIVDSVAYPVPSFEDLEREFVRCSGTKGRSSMLQEAAARRRLSELGSRVQALMPEINDAITQHRSGNLDRYGLKRIERDLILQRRRDLGVQALNMYQSRHSMSPLPDSVVQIVSNAHQNTFACDVVLIKAAKGVVEDSEAVEALIRECALRSELKIRGKCVTDRQVLDATHCNQMCRISPASLAMCLRRRMKDSRAICRRFVLGDETKLTARELAEKCNSKSKKHYE